MASGMKFRNLGCVLGSGVVAGCEPGRGWLVLAVCDSESGDWCGEGGGTRGYTHLPIGGTRGQSWAPMVQGRHPLSGVLVCSVVEGWRPKRWSLGNKEGRSEQTEQGPRSDR